MQSYEDQPDPLCFVLNDSWDEADVSPGFTKPFSEFYRLFNHLCAETTSDTRWSRAQSKSFWILWHWWTSYRSLCEVSSDDPPSDFARHLAEGVSYELNVNSLHFIRLARLFEREFGGPGFVRAGSDLLAQREEAAKFSACHHIALHCYRNALQRPDCGLRKLDQADYHVMLNLPPQRPAAAGDEKLILGDDNLAGLHPRCPTGATLQPCNWLPENKELPFYLWDRTTKEVVLTNRLSHRPAYTAISHTWGRWEKREHGPVSVKGVRDWLVPQNTIFEVRSLPDILAEVPTSSRYIWFDLVCIPQDGSDKASEEIARQAAIFGNAEHVIVWFNRLESWDGLERAIEYMCMIFLSVDARGMPTPGGDPTGFFETYQYDTTILREHMTTDGWFSSLWTLQEICLRPDMWLCNTEWKILSVDKKTIPVAMDTIVALTQECTQGLDGRASLSEEVFPNGPPLFNPSTEQVPPNEMLGKLIGYGVYHRGYLELSELLNRTGMYYLHFMRRDLILLLGSHRFCRDLRAEAIMSVVGSRSWKQDHCMEYTQLVLGMYPLPFVQEVRAAIGANFFNSVSASSRQLADMDESLVPESLGSLMPFESKTPGSEVKLILDWIFSDEIDHPSVANWKILQTGSVEVPRAGIFYSTNRSSIEIVGELICNVWLTYESPEHEDKRFTELRKARRFRSVELREWFQTYFPYSENYAVELCRVNSRIGSTPSSRGILVKEVTRGSRNMLKIGNYISSAYLPLSEKQVVEEQVDWTIL